MDSRTCAHLGPPAPFPRKRSPPGGLGQRIEQMQAAPKAEGMASILSFQLQLPPLTAAGTTGTPSNCAYVRCTAVVHY